MENLTQYIVYGVLFAVLYFIIGYHVAKTSRNLRKNWDKNLLDGLFATAPLKVFLYPMLAAEAAVEKQPFWLLDESSYHKPSYVVKHMFLWPARIIVNLFLIFCMFILIPIVSFLAVSIFSIVVGAIGAVIGKIKSETSS